MIAMQLRDVETMMNQFYPDGAWFEGIIYWEYTMAYTVNMLSTLEACFGTDFNLSKTPGLSNSIYFDMAGDGSVGLNNFHDSKTEHETTNTYFWLSNKYDLPGVTNVRLNQFSNGTATPTPFDMLWYDTSIKGMDFYLPKDTYMRGVEFCRHAQFVDRQRGGLALLSRRRSGSEPTRTSTRVRLCSIWAAYAGRRIWAATIISFRAISAI